MAAQPVRDAMTGRRWSAPFAIVVGLAYVVWRAADTLAGVAAWLAISALVIEVAGVAGTAVLLIALRRPRRSAVDVSPAGDEVGPIDVVVRFDGQSVGNLHATLAGVRHMFDIRRVAVITDRVDVATNAVRGTTVAVLAADSDDPTRLRTAAAVRRRTVRRGVRRRRRATARVHRGGAWCVRRRQHRRRAGLSRARRGRLRRARCPRPARAALRARGAEPRARWAGRRGLPGLGRDRPSFGVAVGEGATRRAAQRRAALVDPGASRRPRAGRAATPDRLGGVDQHRACRQRGAPQDCSGGAGDAGLAAGSGVELPAARHDTAWATWRGWCGRCRACGGWPSWPTLVVCLITSRSPVRPQSSAWVLAGLWAAWFVPAGVGRRPQQRGSVASRRSQSLVAADDGRLGRRAVRRWTPAGGRLDRRRAARVAGAACRATPSWWLRC